MTRCDDVTKLDDAGRPHDATDEHDVSDDEMVDDATTHESDVHRQLPGSTHEHDVAGPRRPPPDAGHRRPTTTHDADDLSRTDGRVHRVETI